MQKREREPDKVFVNPASLSHSLEDYLLVEAAPSL